MIVIFVFIVAWAAFAISAVAGGGAGLVIVPLLRMLIAIDSVPAALSIGTAASSVSRIAIFRRAIRWDVVVRFVPTALPAAALGAWLLTRFQPVYVELILACFLLANLPALFRRRGGVAVAHRPLGDGWLPLLGAAAGLLSGFTGAVGLLFNGTYHRLGMERQEIVATRATNEVLLHVLKLLLYMMFGLLDRAALAAGLLIALAAILASLSVGRILPFVREQTFRTVGSLATVAAGAAMFCLSGGQLMRMHRAWIDIVSPGGEHEVRLHWRGQPKLALEVEREALPVVERTIPATALPAGVRHAARLRMPRDAVVTQIEQVHGIGGTLYEIYFRTPRGAGKIEIDPAAIPAPSGDPPHSVRARSSTSNVSR